MRGCRPSQASAVTPQEVRKERMMNLLIAKAKTERSKIISNNRQDARTRAMELCQDLSSCGDTVPEEAVALQRQYQHQHQHLNLHPQFAQQQRECGIDVNAEMVSDEQHQHQHQHQKLGPEQEQEGPHARFEGELSTLIVTDPLLRDADGASSQAHGPEFDNILDDHDQLRRLFGQDAFDEFMIRLENVLMADDDELEGCYDADLLQGEVLVDNLCWDDDRFIVCPLCKRLPMEIDPVACTGICACSAPLCLRKRRLVPGVCESQGLSKTDFETLLGDEYERHSKSCAQSQPWNFTSDDLKFLLDSTYSPPMLFSWCSKCNARSALL